MGFLKFLATLITIVVGMVGIYQFITGYDSFGEIFRGATQLGQVETQIKSAQEEKIKRVRLEKYRPFFREPEDEAGIQNIWATEPGHLVPFTRPASIVRLECDKQRRCNGTRIMPIPKRMKHIDTMAIDAHRREFLIVDRYGNGAIHRMDESTYFEFSISLPCQTYSNFGGGTGSSGGIFSTHFVAFGDNVLTFSAHASDCAG